LADKVEIQLSASGAEAVAKVFNDLAAKSQQFGKNLTGGAKEAEGALNSLSSAGKRIFEIFTGFTFGNIFINAISQVKDLTLEFIKLGHEARNQEETFKLVAQSVGVSASALEAGLKRASDGLANTSDIMLAGARALQNSLRPDQIVGLMEVARAQAKLAGKDVTQAFNDIATAATNQQVRQLKAYGIIIDANRAYEQHAIRLGTVKEALTEVGQTQAIAIAVMENMKGKLVESSSEIIKQEEAMRRWKVSLQEAGETIGKNLIEAFVAFRTWIKSVDDALRTSAIGQLIGKIADKIADVKKASAEAAGVGETGMGFAKLSELPAPSPKVAEQIDRVKAAAAAMQAAIKAVDADMAIFNARMGTFTTTAEAFAAVIEKDIAKLQALGSQDADVVVKIETLRGTLFKLQEQIDKTAAAFQALLGRTADYVDGAEQIIQQTEKEQKATADFQSSLVALNAQFDLFGDEQSRQAALMGALQTRIKALLDDGLTPTDAAVVKLTDDFRDLAAAQALVAVTKAITDEQVAAAEALMAQTEDATKATADFQKQMATLNDEFELFGNVQDTVSQKMNVLQSRIRALLEQGLKPTDAEVQALANDLKALQADQFAAQLQQIEVSAAALGDTFDALGARIGLLQQQFRTMAADAQGVLTPELKALGLEIQNLVNQQKVQQMLSQFTDSFQNALEAVRGSLQSVLDALSTFFQTGKLDFTNFFASIKKTLSDFAAKELVGGVIKFVMGDKASTDPLVAASQKAAASMTGPLVSATTTTATAMREDLRPAVIGLADTMRQVSSGALSGGSSNGVTGPLLRLGDAATDTAGSFTSVTDAALGFGDAWNTAGTTAAGNLDTLGEAAMGGADALIAGSSLAVSGFSAAAQGASSAAQATGNALAPAAVGAANALGFIPRIVQGIAGLFGGGGGGTGGTGGGGGGGGLGLVNAFLGGGGGGGFQQILGFAQNLNSVVNGLSSLGQGLYIAVGNLIGFTEVLGPAATGIQILDMASAGASVGEISTAMSAASAGVSTFGVALAGVGAALTVFQGIMALVNGQTATGIGTLSGAAAGALIGGGIGLAFAGGTFGTSVLLGALIGAGIGGAAGGGIGGLFEKQLTAYEIKRLNAQAIASVGIGTVASTYAAAAKSQSPSELQAALAGRSGQVYTILQLPQAIADSLGILGEKIAGDLVQVNWGDLTRAQFEKVIGLFKANPALAQTALLGSADVPYLAGGDAATNAGIIKNASLSLIAAFNAIGDYIKNVNELTSTLSLGAAAALPKEFATAIQSGLIAPLKAGMLALLDTDLSVDDLTKALGDFETQAKGIGEIIDFSAQMIEQFKQVSATVFAALPTSLQTTVTPALNSIRDRMLAALSSGMDVKIIAQQLQDLQKEQAALGSLVSMYDTINSEIATMGGNFAQITQRAIAGHVATMAALNENVTTATTALNEPDANRTLEQEAALVKAVHDAIIARYKYEVEAIAALEKDIGNILTQFGTPLASLLNSLAAYRTLTTGSTAQFTALQGVYLAMANSAKSATLQMWALQQGLQAVAAQAQATVAAALKGQGPLAIGGATAVRLGGAGVDVTALSPFVQGIFDAAAPFISKLQRLADEAVDRGDLQAAVTLLQQEQAAAQQIAAIAIQAVNDWADAAIKAVQEFGAAQIKSITDAAKAQTDALQHQIDANNKIIEATEKTAAAQIKANNKLIDIANKQIDAIQKAADAQIRANQAQIDGLNKNIAAIQKAADIQIKANQTVIDSLDKQITAAQRAADAQTKINDAQIKSLDHQVAAIEKAATIQVAANSAQIDGLNKTIDAAQRAADIQTHANDVQIAALNKEITAAQRVADLQTKANDAQIKSLSAQISVIEKAAQVQVDANTLQSNALDKQIQAINAAAQAQQEVNSLQIDALGAQKDALQDAVRLAQDWQQAIDSVKKQIQGLLLGPSAPLNPMDQLRLAQESFQTALGNATTPKGVAEAQAAGDALINALGAVFARPSIEYQKIFNEVIGQLRGLQGMAEGQRGPASLDDLNAQLEAVNAQLKGLQDANKAIADATKAQIGPLQDQVDALKALNDSIKAAADAQTAPMKEQVEALQELNASIKDTLDAQTQPMKDQVDALQELNATIKDSLDAQIQPLKDQVTALQDLNAAIQAATDAQTGPMKDASAALQQSNEDIRDALEATLQPLLDQKQALEDTNAAIKENTDAILGPMKDAVEALQQANTDIKAAADALVQPLKDNITALQDLNTTIQANSDAITGPLREQNEALAAQITAINTARDEQILRINQATEDQIAIINGARDAQINAINTGLNATLTNIANQMGPLVERLVGVPLAIETAMTGGRTTTEFLTTATREATTALNALNATLTAYLLHLGATPPPATGGGGGGSTPAISTSTEWRHALDLANLAQPNQTWWQLVSRNASTLPMMSSAEFDMLVSSFGREFTRQSLLDAIHQGNPTWMPTAQSGAWRTKEGPYYLHADEMVLTRQQADMYRGHSGGGGTTTIAPTLNITVNVEGKADEDMIERAVKRAVAETETSARIGRLNRIIQEQVR